MIHLVASAALALAPAAVVNPRMNHDGWVSDMADILDATAERALEERLDALHTDLDVEVALVTIEAADRTPKDFATDLFELWQIGDQHANNGLLVLMVMDERRLEMETGYGLEPVLPDSWLGAMQKRDMVPQFRQGAYARGLEVGLAQVDERLRAHPEEARLGTRGQTAVQRLRAGEPRAWVGVAAAGGVAGGLLAGSVVVVRRRRRTCPDCSAYMPMLSEEADDEHLSPPERTEEAIGSVDYQVHACRTCDHTRTFRALKWLSGYSSCPSCGARTRRTRRQTVRTATTVSSGLARITETCAHCSYHQSYTRTIPRVSRSSSSSSFGGGGGGGSSFGGGSSGGGGAGSSW